MTEPKILEENERGQTRVEGNALIQDSLIDDAAEMRVGGPNGGKFSLDVVQRDENGKVISRRAIAEVTCGEGVFGAEFTISVLKKGGQSVDGDMVKAIRITQADGIELLLPTKGVASSGLKPRTKIALRSLANGRLVCAEAAGDQPLQANRDVVGPWETFEVIEVPE